MSSIEDFRRIKAALKEASDQVVSLDTEIKLTDDRMDALLTEMGVESEPEAREKLEKLQSAFQRAEQEIKKKVQELNL